MSAKKGEEAEEMQTNLQTNIINFADIEEGGGKNLKNAVHIIYGGPLARSQHPLLGFLFPRLFIRN